MHDAANVLGSYTESATLAQEVQHTATLATAELAQTLTRMSDYTQLEMVKMNDTATKMREDILAGSRFYGIDSLWTGGEAWLKSATTWLLKASLGGACTLPE